MIICGGVQTILKSDTNFIISRRSQKVTIQLLYGLVPVPTVLWLYAEDRSPYSSCTYSDNMGPYGGSTPTHEDPIKPIRPVEADSIVVKTRYMLLS